MLLVVAIGSGMEAHTDAIRRTGMNIYECTAIIEQMDALAAKNDGELPDEQLQQLVEAQTTSIQSLGKLCGFIKHLEHSVALCKTEEARIAEMRRKAQSRLDSVKQWLTPFVEAKGKPTTVGTFTLSTRTSTSVELADDFAKQHEGDPTLLTTKTAVTPNKVNIKAALNDGAKIKGAKLVKSKNLQLK